MKLYNPIFPGCFILCFLLQAGSGYSQTKEYLDRYFFVCSKDSAVFYRLAYYDKDSIYHGNIKTYYLSGKQYSDISYYHGISDGSWKWWFENGQIAQEWIYDNGDSYKKSSWLPSGKPMVIDGNGLDSNLHILSGKIISYGLFKNGQMEGKWQWWHENGQVEQRSELLNDTEIYLTEHNSEFSNNSVKDGTGIKEDHYKKGVIKVKGAYVNGKREDKWVWYHDNGKPSDICYYKNGKLNGLYEEFYKNGKLKFQGTYNYGTKNGIFTWWWWNGNKKETGKYDNGDYSIENTWSEDGKEMVVNGKGYYESFYLSGIRKCAGYFDKSEKTGLWKWFYKSGKLQEEGEYINDKFYMITSYDSAANRTVTKGQGEYTSYHETNKISVKGQYMDGLRVGEWTWYYKNGTINETAEYKNGELTGKHISYYENTNKKFEILPMNDTIFKKYYYDSGKPSEEGYVVKNFYYQVNSWTKEGVQMVKAGNGNHREYHKNGTLSLKGNYLDKIQEGVWEWYYDNGKLKESATFKKGALNGKYNTYFETGVLKFKGNFKNGEKEGECLWYHENGVLSYKGSYVNGKANGKHLSYDTNGELIETKRYSNGFLQRD